MLPENHPFWLCAVETLSLVRGLFLKYSQDLKFETQKCERKFPVIVGQGKHMDRPPETRNHTIIQTDSRGINTDPRRVLAHAECETMESKCSTFPQHLSLISLI